MKPLLAEGRNCAIFDLWLYHTRIEFHNSTRTIKSERVEKKCHVAGCKSKMRLKLKQKEEKI